MQTFKLYASDCIATVELGLLLQNNTVVSLNIDKYKYCNFLEN